MVSRFGRAAIPPTLDEFEHLVCAGPQQKLRVISIAGPEHVWERKVLIRQSLLDMVGEGDLVGVVLTPRQTLEEKLSPPRFDNNLRGPTRSAMEFFNLPDSTQVLVTEARREFFYFKLLTS